MKKIYVTVDEFLANGGELEEGREIYSDEYVICGTFVDFSDIYSTMIIVKNYRATYPMYQYKFAAYVEIEAQPIYK